MDFSCDVRKKYLLLECIDCFNGREQRAEEKEGTGDIEECAESITLIRRAPVMHRQIYAHTYTHIHALIYLASFVL